jgi:glycosyltransferase involved in cell wall biosynthesis
MESHPNIENQKDVSLVIACYNETPVLEVGIHQILKTLASTCWSYEIIFVDDCSQDGTPELIQKLMKKYPNHDLRAMFHEINCGRGRTVSDGFRIAVGNVVGYIDIDLEVSSCYIPSMVLAIQDGADIATALRVYRIAPKLFHRFLLSNGYKYLVRLFLGLPLKDTETGYKFFRRDKLMSILDQVKDPGWFWDTEIMTRAYLAGYTIKEIPCLFTKRYDKKSSVHLFRDSLYYLIKLIKFQRALQKKEKSTNTVVEEA